MARTFKRLKYEDRKKIEIMCREGKNVSELAQEMGVHRATIYHELNRGGAGNGKRMLYSAEVAQRAIFEKK